MYLREQRGQAMRMADIPDCERPREKLKDMGPGALSDRELLAVILGSGQKGTDVMTLAGAVLDRMDQGGGLPSMENLIQIKGMGLAKASLIVAALEFARRRIRPEGVKVQSPAHVLPLIRHYADRKQEHLICISLNGANEVIATRVITIGLLNRTQIHPREVYADALTDRAAAIILAHNHPSGQVDPSPDDRSVTRRIQSAGDVLGVPLLDHLIFSARSYYSFKETGEM